MAGYGECVFDVKPVSGVGNLGTMLIRQTKTRNATIGEPYSTFRLVASERVGKQVRQRTLLNLGRHFSLAKDEWPFLCSRIEFLLSGQKELVPQPVPAAIESLA